MIYRSTNESRILCEERSWDEISRKILGGRATLCSVSRHVGDSRVYVAGERMAKIRSLRVALPQGVSSLAQEAEILRLLGSEVEYVRDDSWEALIQPCFPGVGLDALIGTMPLKERVRLLRPIARAVGRLHARGVAHRDLHPNNFLVSDEGVTLVDFDRAAVGSWWWVRTADFLGPSSMGATYTVVRLLYDILVPRSSSIRSLVGFARNLVLPRVEQKMPRPAYCIGGDRDLALLERAWSLAELSDASSPGCSTAYYSFTYKGCHFPGERPWYMRWDAIRRALDFEGKRILELGCNMGLLSSFASLHGAVNATGVDRDDRILEAASLVARALRADVRFERVDLATDPAWESRFRGADIVAAMSLLHWLPELSRQRVLGFLSGHSEVLYEGHDSLEVEMARLRAAGFAQVDVLAETERHRFLLHARK